VRYLPILAGRVKNIIFKPQDLLYDLIKANYPAIKVLSSNNDDSTLIFDCHISIVSLLKQLKVNVHNIPSAEGYLKSFKYNPDSRLENLFSFEGLKIGLCWNSSHLNDKRNISLEKLKPVLDFSNNRYYSLQQENGAEQLNNPDFQDIINIAPNLFDFAATAVFIKKMDLIITVDSAVAHLAAAMNKPVFILLPAVPDWRWGINSETTPWYNSAVLIRQEKPYNWDSAITKLKEKLITFQKNI
jgi:ADP-heptose:LPS heptosyltransferase